MDSEHRHELEENSLALWLGDRIEEIKPQLPAIGVGLVVLVAGLIGLNGWRASAANAEAERWRDFAVAVEGSQPNEDLLQQAVQTNPGTPVAEWAEITWADGKLYDASNNFFRNRAAADESLDEAIAVYERLVGASDRDVAERAGYQLARAYELKGDLEKAREQYGRVAGPFAELALNRAEELGSPSIQASYAWITATRSAPAAPGAEVGDDFEPDDLALPEVDSAEADETLQDLLDTVEDEVDAEEPAAEETEADSEAAADETPPAE